MATKAIGVIKMRPLPICKRTSIGGRHRPKNKHRRKNFKAYRGQGRV